ncbi:hypothetical protein CMO83_02480 [Candidatus Woesearchaeota archaeon]|jgi:hypothetical protein|nr:hypothetical protein [Candidatus Woesearchaeota archaeon]MDP6648274.1 hypothetical protein [Candidatus Woesearchaeota archaeon]|tara:strand:- start:30330 stop:30797 length:468 start_codon:yes stop_codon:yes gene_type:complete
MENKSHSFLLEWTISFIKNKDIISKRIEKIERGKYGFDLYVKYKDREHYFIIAPKIVDIGPIIQKINDKSYFSLVTLNSRENFDVILKNWKRFIDFKFFSIIFTNPFSELDKKWVVFPHTHHKISDESALENGLKSMFQTVEPIGEQQLAAKITS